MGINESKWKGRQTNINIFQPLQVKTMIMKKASRTRNLHYSNSTWPQAFQFRTPRGQSRWCWRETSFSHLQSWGCADDLCKVRRTSSCRWAKRCCCRRRWMLKVTSNKLSVSVRAQRHAKPKRAPQGGLRSSSRFWPWVVATWRTALALSWTLLDTLRILALQLLGSSAGGPKSKSHEYIRALQTHA